MVSDFFDLLDSGQTSEIAALLTNDSALISSVIDDAFYATAVARPVDAKVTAASESEPGVVYVTVEYSLAGEDRDMKVAVVRGGGAPKIDGWLHDTLSVDPLRAPGAWAVNGELDVGEVEQTAQFVALPGLYSFGYVDPHSLGTIDPDGAPSDAFEVEFPIDRDQLRASLSPGVTTLSSSIGAEPRLLATVDDEVEAQLAALIDECSASGLVSDSCPPDLVVAVRALGAVDTNTILWTDESPQHIVPSGEWGLVADYSVAFNYLDAPGRGAVDTTYAGVINADAQGAPVFERAG